MLRSNASASASYSQEDLLSFPFGGWCLQITQLVHIVFASSQGTDRLCAPSHSPRLCLLVED